MGVRLLFVFGVLTIFAAFVVDSLIQFGTFEHVYNHQPGNCKKYDIQGAEDMVLLPNDQVLISSGYCIWLDTPRETNIFMFDLKAPSAGPQKLAIDGSFLEETPDFTPHGMGHWIDDDGLVYLYVINHRRESETVECFLYNAESLSLKHRKTFKDTLFSNLNNLVLVGLDEFYVTHDLFFNSFYMKILETHTGLSWGVVIYYNANRKESKIAATSLSYPNGIAKSNSGKFIYVSNMLKGEVIAFTRNQDDTLTAVQTLTLQPANDNLFVSPVNDHLWVAVFPKPISVWKLLVDSDTPMAGRIFHVTVDANASLPFNDSKVEEVFSTTGEGFFANTIAVYHDGKLLVGTVCNLMMYCDAPFLMYPE